MPHRRHRVYLVEPDLDQRMLIQARLGVEFVLSPDVADVSILDGSLWELSRDIGMIRIILPSSKIIVASAIPELGQLASLLRVAALTKPYDISELQELVAVSMHPEVLDDGLTLHDERNRKEH